MMVGSDERERSSSLRGRTSSNLSNSSDASDSSKHSSESLLAGLYPEILDFSIHLSEKTVFDNEPVEGYVRLAVEDAENYVEDVVIALRTTFCYRLEDGAPYETLLHEVIQRGAVPFVGGMPAGNYEYPFSFKVKEGLPPSIILTSMVDHRPLLAVKYEIRAYAMHEENNPLNRLHLRSIAPIIRKITISPPKELTPLPSVTNSRTFAFGGDKPLSMTVTLNKHVFRRGEPISVSVHVDNKSTKKVYALRLSAKQIIDVCVSPGKFETDEEKLAGTKTYSHKQHLAVVEDFDDCPIKKGQVVDTEMHFRAEDSFHYGLALTLEENGKGEISPTSIKSGIEYVAVHYYLNIHCCVHLASDLVCTLPFVISEKPAIPEGLRDHPPAYYSSQFDNNFESDDPQKLLDSIHPFGMSAEDRARNKGDSSLVSPKNHAIMAEMRGCPLPDYDLAVRRPSIFTKLEDVPTMARKSSKRRSRLLSQSPQPNLN